MEEQERSGLPAEEETKATAAAEEIAEAQPTDEMPLEAQLPDETPHESPAEAAAAQKALRRSVRRVFSRIGVALLVGILSASLVYYLLDLLFSSLKLTVNAMLLNTLCIDLVGVPLCYLLLKKLPALPPEKRKCGPGRFFGFVAICFAAMVAGSIIGNLLINLFAPGSLDVLGEMLDGSGLALGTVISLVVLAPLFEELLFRKLILDRIGQYGMIPAMLFSGLVFGLYHMNLSQFIYAALLGVLLAYLYLSTGKIFLCVAAHGCLNLLGGVVPMLVNQMKLEMGDAAAGAASTGIYLVLYAIAIAGVVLFIRNVRKTPLDKTRFKGVGPLMYLNGGMLLYVLFCLAMIVILLVGMTFLA